MRSTLLLTGITPGAPLLRPVAWSKTLLVNSGSDALQTAKAMPASSPAIKRSPCTDAT